MTQAEMVAELEAILVYCLTISRCDNRAIMKLLVRDEIKARTTKLLKHMSAVAEPKVGGGHTGMVGDDEFDKAWTAYLNKINW